MSGDPVIAGGSAGFVRPAPQPDPVSQGFWDAAARGELAIQRCTGCGIYQHPPRPLCRRCGGTALRFEAVSGRGRLWGWSAAHHTALDRFRGVTPYTVLVVELEEQKDLFLLSDLIGREAGELKLGMPMRAVFTDRAGDGLVLPQFEPMETRR